MYSSTQSGYVRFVSPEREIRFSRPVETLCARAISEVGACLERVESAVAQGLNAAGYIAYEAAPAFDAALDTHDPRELPLLWFGLYDKEEVVRATPALVGGEPPDVGPWRPLVDRDAYVAAIRRIRELIAAGDTYQVNYTFPMEAAFAGDALGWFVRLIRAQEARYSAFLDTGRFKILSISPELFFRLDGRRLETKPMKGTRPRGRWPTEDRVMAEALGTSEKDRAENVMIVDLLRNDMGRISETGSVQVQSLFDLERYPTVWQMTSTITSRARTGASEVLRALFPSGSVTGAPKVRTMQIIRELEPHPRGVYCGTVGWWAPDGRAEFNVAIRTVTVDAQRAMARYNVGGGITWDSTPGGEYEECRTKACLLSYPVPDFRLLESILYDGEYFLLDEHLERLAASADYFGFDMDPARVQEALGAAARGQAPGPQKVRLLVSRDGSLEVESAPAGPPARVRAGFAREPVDSGNVFLFHKTTHRDMYEAAAASRPDCDDVLLWNRRGEITESTRANVVLELDGELLTPPVASGLLGGTFRGHLLAEGILREAVLTKEDVTRVKSIRLINSVRRWIDVAWVD